MSFNYTIYSTIRRIYFWLFSSLLYRIFVLTTIAFLVICGESSTAGSFIEDASYYTIKELLLASGYSETYAECYVKILKFSGTLNDIKNIRDINKIKEKSEFADFICSPIGMGVVVTLLLLFVIAIICVCLRVSRSKCCWTIIAATSHLS